ncbi:MAG: proline--tRNA ligase [Thermodesulfobacteria bacterium]|nr:proline--tRNA ligase [Thermodesulfobacteriota bacterium]
MRYSKFFIPTLKEVPAEAEIASHKLMLRAGMIRKIASGLYTYLPLGLRAIRKVENIVRQEMNRSGAVELLMPLVQPAELWKESGRWDHYGKELLRFKDRHGRDFCLGPTHEEVITDLIRKHIRSYRDLPLNLYQIQTKFRDEIRPRFGLMRAREFIMKDAYSFSATEESLDEIYQTMYKTYCRIFERCGLDFRPVEADTGSIGGHASHEFMVLADTGEDDIACCTKCNYAANTELAEVKKLQQQEPFAPGSEALKKVSTPGRKTVEEVTEFLNKKANDLIKTLIFLADEKPVAALVRGDHEINEVKLKKVLGAEELEMAGAETVEALTGAPVGFAGPLGLPDDVKVVADHSVAYMKDFVAGANEKDAHYTGLNWKRDLDVVSTHDIRVITEADPCPRCGAPIEIKRGIEVGHIFKLGTKYSEAMGATFLDSNGKEKPIIMGCYGIGIGRTVAAAIEQNHDERGIIFPVPIAPFEVIISLINVKDEKMSLIAKKLYDTLFENGIEVLFDDRNERPGVKFKDSELIGIPFRVTVGKKAVEEGVVEVTDRRTMKTELVAKEDVLQRLVSVLHD